jgi:sarcosine oxidase/L-pipecolate oxidase
MASSTNLVFDITVIGAGVEGSSTAYRLSKMAPGKKLALVEQFDLGHSRGSSHGGSRIFRTAYHRDCYTNMLTECVPLWRQLEIESGKEIWVQTGGINFGPEDAGNLWACADALKKHNVPYSVLNADEMNRRFPILNLPPNYKCVMEKDAGILRAPNALKAYQGQFVKNGGVLLENCKVEKIVPGTSVKLYTSKGVITTRHLVITAGTWTGKLVEQTGLKLPLKVWRPNVLYWAVGDEKIASPDRFPVFVSYDEGGSEFDAYGLPICEYPGLVKICLHEGIEVDPDSRDLAPERVGISRVANFIQKHFSGVALKPSVVETCMYTVTPDHDLILDRHPKYPNVIIGAGFSGHGFKLSPVVGKILSELALDLPPSYDMKPYRIDRFTPKGKL